MKVAIRFGNLTALIMLVAIRSADAAPFTWVGGTDSNDWTIGANWTGGTAPTFATASTQLTMYFGERTLVTIQGTSSGGRTSVLARRLA